MANALATTATKNAQPATADAQPKTFRDLITTAKYREELAKALPHGVTPDHVTKIFVASLNRNPALLECSLTSTWQALVECATLNLWPGPLGHMYLVSRNNRVRATAGGEDRWEKQMQAQIGYRGMVELANRSGMIRPGSFYAQAVYERDDFEMEFGSTPRLVHKPKLGDRGAIVGAYAVCTPKGEDAVPIFHVMSKQDIDAIKARSSSKDRQGNVVGPWITDYAEMACKTTARRLWKYLPSSITDKYADVLERDAEREFDFAKEAEATVVPDAKPAKVRGEAAPPAIDAPPQEDAAPEPEPEAPAEAQAPPPTATQATATEFAKRVIQDLGDELAGDIIGKALAAVGAGTVKQLQPAQCGPFLAKLTGLYDVARGAA